MTTEYPNAPIWRRMVSAIYDGLLYFSLVAAGIVLSTPVVSALVAKNGKQVLANFPILQCYAVLVGLGFFGYSWVKGGQTLGMRVWRLKVVRINGMPLGWTTASLRYLVAWMPVLLGLVAYKYFSPSLIGLALSGYLPCLISNRGRALHDLVAGTEVLELPKA